MVAFLQGVEDEGFLDELPKLAGGTEAGDAIKAYLDRYGMRCVGEIDITRPRWSERSTTLDAPAARGGAAKAVGGLAAPEGQNRPFEASDIAGASAAVPAPLWCPPIFPHRRRGDHRNEK
ncbi:hypothetical protein OHA25_06740 [Nonomuraea sp. NBC_00507]|uniref:hypothetical protein n=1 Tax=Nonomuraea sp. NBC_00507 TaxID=2976002 RepID=UPI002E186123